MDFEPAEDGGMRPVRPGPHIKAMPGADQHTDAWPGQKFATSGNVTFNRSVLCPDLLRLEDIGEADAWRGKLVRAFFRVLKVLTGV